MNNVQWLEKLLPASCVFCRQQAAPAGICAACYDDLPVLEQPCTHCAEPVPAAIHDAPICAACQQRPPPWAACRSALPYAWPVDLALQRLKYSRQLVYAAAFGALLARLAAAEFPDVDALCPVPLHRWRHLRRGFNQAEELCGPIRRDSGLPVFGKLRRVRATAPQSGLPRAARRQNLQGAFRMTGRCDHRHVLLIDDIMTTGETCRQLAELLLANGARRVSVLTVARASYGGYGGAANV